MTPTVLKNKLRKKLQELYPSYFRHSVSVTIEFSSSQPLKIRVFFWCQKSEEILCNNSEHFFLESRSISDLFDQLNQKIDGVGTRTKLQFKDPQNQDS